MYNLEKASNRKVELFSCIDKNITLLFKIVKCINNSSKKNKHGRLASELSKFFNKDSIILGPSIKCTKVVWLVTLIKCYFSCISRWNSMMCYQENGNSRKRKWRKNQCKDRKVTPGTSKQITKSYWRKQGLFGNDNILNVLTTVQSAGINVCGICYSNGRTAINKLRNYIMPCIFTGKIILPELNIFCIDHFDLVRLTSKVKDWMT